MVTTMPLLENLDGCSAEQPLVGKVITTTIGGLLFKTGRFEERKLTQTLQHVGEARAQKSKKCTRKRSLRHSEVYGSNGTISRQ